MMLLGSDFKSKLKRKVEEDSSDKANPAPAGEEKGGLDKVGLRGHGVRMEVFLAPRSNPWGVPQFSPLSSTLACSPSTS